jgi:hypothetical protein
MNATAAGYIIAGPSAIFATGETQQAALDQYIESTGDDQYTLDTIGTDPRSGHVYLMPATAALLKLVYDRGGDVCWDDLGSIADIGSDE